MTEPTTTLFFFFSLDLFFSTLPPAAQPAGAGHARSQAELWSDMENWRFGHPRAALLPTGEVFVVYYAGDDRVKSARWARLSVED